MSFIDSLASPSFIIYLFVTKIKLIFVFSLVHHRQHHRDLLQIQATFAIQCANFHETNIDINQELGPVKMEWGFCTWVES
jgi:hypothetical protein